MMCSDSIRLFSPRTIDLMSEALRAPGLTPRAVLEKLAAMQLLDVHEPAVTAQVQ